MGSWKHRRRSSSPPHWPSSWRPPSTGTTLHAASSRAGQRSEGAAFHEGAFGLIRKDRPHARPPDSNLGVSPSSSHYNNHWRIAVPGAKCASWLYVPLVALFAAVSPITDAAAQDSSSSEVRIAYLTQPVRVTL